MRHPPTTLNASAEATQFEGQSIGGQRRPAARLRRRPGGLPSGPSADHPYSRTLAEAAADARHEEFLFAKGCLPGRARSARLSAALEINFF